MTTTQDLLNEINALKDRIEELEGRPVFQDIDLVMTDSDRYPRLDWIDEQGKVVANIVAHRHSNPKLQSDGTYVTYAHNHMTLPYAIDDNGKLRGLMDVTFGNEHEQYQFENADIVMKSNRANLVLRGDDSKYYKVEVIGGEISLSQMPDDYIIWANVPV